MFTVWFCLQNTSPLKEASCSERGFVNKIRHPQSIVMFRAWFCLINTSPPAKRHVQSVVPSTRYVCYNLNMIWTKGRFTEDMLSLPVCCCQELVLPVSLLEQVYSCLFLCLFICLSVCESVCLSVCLSVSMASFFQELAYYPFWPRPVLTLTH